MGTSVPPLQQFSSKVDIMVIATNMIFNAVKIVSTNVQTVYLFVSTTNVANPSSGGTSSVRPSAPSIQTPNPLPVVLIAILPLLSQRLLLLTFPLLVVLLLPSKVTQVLLPLLSQRASIYGAIGFLLLLHKTAILSLARSLSLAHLQSLHLLLLSALLLHKPAFLPQIL